MRRLLVVFVLLITAAAAGFVVWALSSSQSRTLRAVGGQSDQDLGRVRLQVDPHVTPMGREKLVPGADVRYEFEVTNTGDEPVDHVVVRSVMTDASDADVGEWVVAVSDPACWGSDRVDCIFPSLGPGEKRTVQVIAETSARERPGERLVIRTFVGRFTGPAGGPVPLSVVGAVRMTTGRFS